MHNLRALMNSHQIGHASTGTPSQVRTDRPCCASVFILVSARSTIIYIGSDPPFCRSGGIDAYARFDVIALQLTIA